MEALYGLIIFILVFTAIGFILFGLFKLLPIIIIIGLVIYLYNRFIAKPKRSSFEETIEESYYNPFQDYTSSTSSHNPDVIDVEYTEREDED